MTDLNELVGLLPDCIRDVQLCSQYEFVGSRITCDPPVLDTDLDVLCMLSDERFGEVIHALELNGWRFDGNEYYANALDQAVGFRSYRNGDLNLVLTTDPQFYRLFSAASSVAKRLNLLDKADRIALFQAVIYGNPAEPPTHATPGAGGRDDVRDSCEWKMDEGSEWTSWETSCGRTWTFVEDGPLDNGVKFCMGCGGMVTVTPAIDASLAAQHGEGG